MDRAKLLKNIGLIVGLFILASIVSAFLSGIIAVLGGNVELVGLSGIEFDPVLTIAYIILYHYLAHFNHISGRAAHILFLFTIFVSFTVNFIQGSIFLIILFYGLRRLKLVGQPPTPNK